MTPGKSSDNARTYSNWTELILESTANKVHHFLGTPINWPATILRPDLATRIGKQCMCKSSNEAQKKISRGNDHESHSGIRRQSVPCKI